MQCRKSKITMRCDFLLFCAIQIHLGLLTYSSHTWTQNCHLRDMLGSQSVTLLGPGRKKSELNAAQAECQWHREGKRPAVHWTRAWAVVGARWGASRVFFSIGLGLRSKCNENSVQWLGQYVSHYATLVQHFEYNQSTLCMFGYPVSRAAPGPALTLDDDTE